MFCNKCGANIPDGAAFCTSCGNPVNSVPQQPTANQAFAETATVGAPRTPATAVMPSSTEPVPSKKKKTGLIIGIVAAAVALIAIITTVLVITLGDRSKDKDTDEGGRKTKTEETALQGGINVEISSLTTTEPPVNPAEDAQTVAKNFVKAMVEGDADTYLSYLAPSYVQYFMELYNASSREELVSMMSDDIPYPTGKCMTVSATEKNLSNEEKQEIITYIIDDYSKYMHENITVDDVIWFKYSYEVVYDNSEMGGSDEDNLIVFLMDGQWYVCEP